MYSTKYGRHAVRLAGWHASHVAYRFVRTLGIHTMLALKRCFTELSMLRLLAKPCSHTMRLGYRLARCAFRSANTRGSCVMILAWLLAFGASSLASASTLASMEDPVPIVMTAPVNVLPYPQPLCSKCKALASRQTDTRGTQTIVLSLGRDMLPAGFVGQIRVTMLFSGGARGEETFDVAIVEDELTLTLTEPMGTSWQTVELLWVELLPTA